MAILDPPQQLTDERRWCVWRYEDRHGKPSKVPRQPNGQGARSNNSEDWVTYDAAKEALATGFYSGVGFFLSDGWAGVDLDDCLDADGQLYPWADEIVGTLNSYTEISPSGKGVKIFVKGVPPDGKQKGRIGEGAIEMYGRNGRYFTVTGDHLGGTPRTIEDRSGQLSTIHARWITPDVLPMVEDPVAEMKKQLLSLPESVQGEHGSDAMFRAACEIRRWGFSGDQGLELLRFYNDNMAHPPWEGGEFQHKWDEAVKAVPEAPGEPAKPKDTVGFDLGLITHTEFEAKEFKQDFLVDRLVVGGEHLIIGGPKKSMKTSLLVDIAVCVASGGGAKVFGEFAVGDEPQPAIIVSGESGGATLQKTAARVCEARGVSPGGNLHWGLRLPNLTLPLHLAALKRDIDRTGAKFVAIDPAYLALLIGDDAKNVFMTGKVLAEFGRVGTETGCTLCLVHHTTKQLKTGTVPGLEHLSMSGFAEWARQWVLLNHAKPYSQGKAWLRASVGGSAGHGELYEFDIDQGARDPSGLGWSDWSVEVRGEQVENDATKDMIAVERGGPRGAERVLAYLEDHPGWHRYRELKAATGDSGRFKIWVDSLVADGRVSHQETGEGGLRRVEYQVCQGYISSLGEDDL